MVTKRIPRRPTEDEIDAIMPPEGPGPAVEDDDPPFEVAPLVLTGAGEKPLRATVATDDDPDDETFVYNQSPRQQRQNGKVFNPAKHFRTLRGGGSGTYLDAKWRLVWVRSEYPNCEIRTELIRLETTGTAKEKIAVFKATVILPEGAGIATGFGSETEGDFKDYIEKAEKKAISRALDHLGYGTAAAEDDGERISDAPVERKRPQPQDAGKRTYQEQARESGNKDKPAGFPPVAWEGQKLVNMPDVRKAMFACIDSENRKVLYRKIRETDGWGNALDEIKVYWGEANEFDSDMEPREG